MTVCFGDEEHERTSRHARLRRQRRSRSVGAPCASQALPMRLPSRSSFTRQHRHCRCSQTASYSSSAERLRGRNGGSSPVRKPKQLNVSRAGLHGIVLAAVSQDWSPQTSTVDPMLAAAGAKPGTRSSSATTSTSSPTAVATAQAMQGYCLERGGCTLGDRCSISVRAASPAPRGHPPPPSNVVFNLPATAGDVQHVAHASRGAASRACVKGRPRAAIVEPRSPWSVPSTSPRPGYRLAARDRRLQPLVTAIALVIADIVATRGGRSQRYCLSLVIARGSLTLFTGLYHRATRQGRRLSATAAVSAFHSLSRSCSLSPTAPRPRLLRARKCVQDVVHISCDAAGNANSSFPR